MHIVENKSNTGKKIYRSILLRESYREGGKVKKRTIANLTGRPPQEIAALKFALKYKGDLAALGSLKESVKLEEGLSVGAVWTIYQVAKRLGIEKTLGSTFHGKLALWQVIARVINQGSRLSAVRLAQTHAACDVLNISRGFDENDLYDNLTWLSDNQDRIEHNLFSATPGKKASEIFLYDVTSTYLEGQQNAFAAYGYNRDKKKGKKQIVIGLLCDEFGDPISTEVFAGNTQDTQTFYSQIRKASERFGCRRVTFVGDRGMIKSAQIEALPDGFHYITAITKPQIMTLIKKGVIRIGLFDEEVCEVEDDGIRYVLRRNPYRAKEISDSRFSKRKSIEKLVEKKNEYLAQHPKAWVSKAATDVTERIERLKIADWLKVKTQGRRLALEMDDKALEDAALLDGCYVIKTDLPQEVADKQIVHDRYKDLTAVEQAFRTYKTDHLEVRPVYVRTEKSTRGHVQVVMLAYKIARLFRVGWAAFDLTVQEGLQQLSTLCSMEMRIKGEGSCLKIPRPRKESRALLKALDIRLPTALPHREVRVVTRKKIAKQRKTS